MRKLAIVAACAAASFVLPSTARAEERAQIGAFGGFTFGDTTSATTFGGNIHAPFARNLEIVAEAGRLEDVMPSTVGTLLKLTPIDFGVSAWYGEAGLRFLASSRSAITPYAETTAGFARMHTGFHGAGSADPYVNAALRFFDRTEPLLGVGGGIIVRGGPLTLDLGYRFKRILASDSLQSALTAGDGINVSQARIGVGVRF